MLWQFFVTITTKKTLKIGRLNLKSSQLCGFCLTVHSLMQFQSWPWLCNSLQRFVCFLLPLSISGDGGVYVQRPQPLKLPLYSIISDLKRSQIHTLPIKHLFYWQYQKGSKVLTLSRISETISLPYFIMFETMIDCPSSCWEEISVWLFMLPICYTSWIALMWDHSFK